MSGRHIEVALAADAGSKRAAGHSEASGPTKLTHRVQKGESLWSIARHYGVHVREIAKWNTVSAREPLRVNQTLDIWSGTGID